MYLTIHLLLKTERSVAFKKKKEARSHRKHDFLKVRSAHMICHFVLELCRNHAFHNFEERSEKKKKGPWGKMRTKYTMLVL